MAQELHPYNEAGRRLKAALISYILGRPGVDRTLIEVPEDVGDGWGDLAKQLIDEMAIVRQQPNPPVPKKLIRIK
jgi:hypothetical protein